MSQARRVPASMRISNALVLRLVMRTGHGCSRIEIGQEFVRFKTCADEYFGKRKFSWRRVSLV